MIFRVPNPAVRKVTKPSRGEVFGELWATKGIDLAKNRGKNTSRFLTHCPGRMVRTGAGQDFVSDEGLAL